MAFEIDEQTKKDLDIFGIYQGSMSIYELFDQCKYKGSQRRLHAFLSNPLTDLQAITEREEVIRFFHKHMPEGLDIDREAFDFANYYMKHAAPVRQPTKYSSMSRKLFDLFTSSAEYFLIEKGVNSMLTVMLGLHKFATAMSGKTSLDDCPELMRKNNEIVLGMFALPEFSKITRLSRAKAYDVATLDYAFRNTHRKYIRTIINMIEEYDVFHSVATVARQRNFCYPEVRPATDNVLEIEGLFHPFVKDAVANDLSYTPEQNLLFVTGPNMAGKSTFLKALGVAVYLAHVGFPVVASKMRLSILSGLCTTINISDSLSSGYSHFYAEVMRIKYVADRLMDSKRILVIFDELFRGTNVKDAYDGTLAIASAFSEIKNSFFIISTHIVEVADEMKNYKNIGFHYFETQEKDGHPEYTYKLREGVSAERLGMYIIRREKIIELIKEAKDKQE